MSKFLVILVVFIPFSVTAQTDTIDCCYNIYSNQIIIQNNSNEDYLFWFSFSPKKERTNRALVVDYFFRARCKNCISLIHMFSSAVVLNNTSLLGLTFIKEIKPRKRFLILLKTDKLVSFLTERMVIIKKTEVESIIKTEIPQDFLYQSSILYVENQFNYKFSE